MQQALASTQKALVDLCAETRLLRESVSALTARESQLRAILEADVALEDQFARLDAILDESRIAKHVTKAIERAELHCSPFPYSVIDELFPKDFFGALVRGIPPVQLFADRAVNKQQLVVPFAMAPAYARRVWKFMTAVVAERLLTPMLVQKFRAPLTEWIAANWPPLASEPLAPPMKLHSSSGRLMLRSRGYNIAPHRDPRWGFVTCLIYLPRPDDLETWGTKLYAVDEDREARNTLPHWIDERQCRLVAEVPFRRNTALVFMNSAGAHGASISDDAEPPDLQRYAYQFRIGPTRESITELLKLLPEDRRAAWSGKMDF
jgi:hypothetical protein